MTTGAAVCRVTENDRTAGSPLEPPRNLRFDRSPLRDRRVAPPVEVLPAPGLDSRAAHTGSHCHDAHRARCRSAPVLRVSTRGLDAKAAPSDPRALRAGQRKEAGDIMKPSRYGLIGPRTTKRNDS